MRSLTSLDFPAPEMEPESAHVVSAVSVPWLQCGDLRCSTTQATFTNPSLLLATPRYSATPCYVSIQLPNVIDNFFFCPSPVPFGGLSHSFNLFL